MPGCPEDMYTSAQNSKVRKRTTKGHIGDRTKSFPKHKGKKRRPDPELQSGRGSKRTARDSSHVAHLRQAANKVSASEAVHSDSMFVVRAEDMELLREAASKFDGPV